MDRKIFYASSTPLQFTKETSHDQDPDPEQFAAVGQANLEAMMSLANSAIARAERLAELQPQHRALGARDSVATTRKLAEAKDPQQLAKLQGDSPSRCSTRPSPTPAASRRSRPRPAGSVEPVREADRRPEQALPRHARAGRQAGARRFRGCVRGRPFGDEHRQQPVRQRQQGRPPAAEVTDPDMAAATEATVKAVGAATKK